jgi:non-canonical purine NTP pyrophosphatase (RdgB/HAM1 family)
MTNNITFVTGNPAKAKYLSDYLHIQVDRFSLDLPEIQSLDLEEIVLAKAKTAYEMIEKPVLVEDVSLTFHALGNLPGPLIKWFLKSLGNQGLAELAHKYADHSATAEVAFCLHDKAGSHIFKGQIKGSVSPEPRGEEGFGWDPVFIPEGQEKTWAEMTDDEKHQTSMRRIALEELSDHIQKTGTP